VNRGGRAFGGDDTFLGKGLQSGGGLAMEVKEGGRKRGGHTIIHAYRESKKNEVGARTGVETKKYSKMCKWMAGVHTCWGEV